MKHLIIIYVGVAMSLSSASASEAMPIEPFPTNMKSPWQNVTDMNAASISELRAIAEEVPDYVTQIDAVRRLLKAADTPTIARVVYAFRQGNDIAKRALSETVSASMIPYLLEDVAHGSVKTYYGESGSGSVRPAATEIMLRSIVQIPGLPTETGLWFNYLQSEAIYVRYVPELSKALLEWWDHNGSAVLSGRSDQATWLPAERKLQSQIYDQWQKKKVAKPPPPPRSEPPPLSETLPALPLHVEEPFAVWVERVTDPKFRDIQWQSIDYELGVSVDTKSNTLLQANLADASSESAARSSSQSRSKPVAVEVNDHISFKEIVAAAGIAILGVGIWYFYRKRN